MLCNHPKGNQWVILLCRKQVQKVLTDQKKLFVDEHIRLRCKNATQAAINAGYSVKSASAQASQLLKNSEVSEYLKKRKDEIKTELQQEFLFDALEAREIMYEIMNDPEASDKNKITVCKDFLDRAGFKPEDNVVVNGNIKTTNPYDELTVEELRALARKCESG